MRVLCVLLALSGIVSKDLQVPDRTLANLQNSYVEEAKSSRKYELYSKRAKEEGYEDIAKLFRALSKSEAIHMKKHKKEISEMHVWPKDFEYPNYAVKTTRENLLEPIKNSERWEKEIYPDYIKTAKLEGDTLIAQSFEYAMRSESQHQKLLKEAFQDLGLNKEVDYFVSNISGETYKASSNEQAPTPKLDGERYIIYQ